MALRHGFKSTTNRIAHEQWDELGLKPWDSLDPFRLADHLGLEVTKMTTVARTSDGFVRHFRGKGQDDFSAITLPLRVGNLIVYNDWHHPLRQPSDICHELAHALLFHEATPPLTKERTRNWHSPIEEEAAWLGGALLIPENSVLYSVRRNDSVDSIAQRYGVSTSLAEWRIGTTGARRRVQRERRRRGRGSS